MAILVQEPCIFLRKRRQNPKNPFFDLDLCNRKVPTGFQNLVPISSATNKKCLQDFRTWCQHHRLQIKSAYRVSELGANIIGYK